MLKCNSNVTLKHKLCGDSALLRLKTFYRAFSIKVIYRNFNRKMPNEERIFFFLFEKPNKLN